MKGGRARALLDQLPNHLTRRIAVPLRGYVRGLVTRGQDQAAKPGPSLSRSRMPVIGLVRLQRALRAANALFDPIRRPRPLLGPPGMLFEPWIRIDDGRQGHGLRGDTASPVRQERR